ncbi:MAG: DUF5711 family protein [Oscillospiraceae bacterium]|nr:DUF5711 family protein [Oscillospiraceae bacterium]
MSRNPNDIVAYRRKDKLKNFLKGLIVFLALVSTVALIVLNWDSIIEPLGGIGAQIQTRTSSEVGFPVRLPGSAGYSFARFGDNFLLLTDTYLYNYRQSGEQMYAFQHLYGSPIMISGKDRVLLYNHSATDFSIFNHGSQLHKEETEQKIVAAFLGNNDMVAIVTASRRFSNELYVYDKNGKQRFIRRFIDENVTAVDFSPDGSFIYIATIKAQSGAHFGTVQKFDLRSEGEAIWSHTFMRGSWVLKMNVSDNYVHLLCDDLFAALDTAKGEIVGVYEYEGNLRFFDSSDSFSVLGVLDIISNDNILITLDQKSSVISTKSMPNNLKQVEVYKNIVYTLEGELLNSYDREFKQTGQHLLTGEYDGFVVIDNSAFLLGFDVVEKIDLKG